MMKLRHLFDNRPLAEMLAANWEYDPPSREMFQYFRISANAIYPFKVDDETCFLRFCPTSEKSRQNIEAELDFLRHLRSRGYRAAQAVPSKSGSELVEMSTPWGEYYASVFKRVQGKQISESDYSERIMVAYGEALGDLHHLSSEYTPPGAARWTHTRVLDWIEATLRELEAVPTALEEVTLLREFFSRLPATQQTYGLIHFDFEPDNVFYAEAGEACSAIDFDDAMYHWYVLDLVQAMHAIQDELLEKDFPDARRAFLRGYTNKFAIDPEMHEAAAIFRRFADLYQYTRVARAVDEHLENEPEWMTGLRQKLDGIMVRNVASFGKPVELP